MAYRRIEEEIEITLDGHNAIHGRILRLLSKKPSGWPGNQFVLENIILVLVPEGKITREVEI